MRFTTISVAAQLAASVLAHPSSSSSSAAVQRRAINIDAFKYKLGASSAKYVSNVVIEEQGLKPRLIARAADDIASALVKSAFPSAEFRLLSSYASSNGVQHIVFKQTAHGIDIDTADFNVNIKDGKVFSYGNSFYSGAIPAASPLVKRDQVDPVVALKSASSTLTLGLVMDAAIPEPEEEVEVYTITGSSGAVSDPKAKLVYFTDGNSLTLSWRLETDILDNWLLTYVDAVTPEKILGLVDYVAEASYNVYPWKTNDPSRGERKIETNSWNLVTSEFTWHSNGTFIYNTTRGNNGNAQANWANDAQIETDPRPYEADLNFDYPLDLTAEDPKSYVNASVTQLFYTANVFHDLLHVLGFNEVSGNFEANNNGQGGIGGDAVTLNTQDGSGTNNANFATPADGVPGRMRMYLWDYVLPKRDSSFDAGVVIHEYTHGLSNRLTGGPANSACLSATESGGMGEGWSDFYAIAIHLKTSDTRDVNYPMGDWIRGRPSGIRTQLYSTSTTTNNMTYETANGSTLVHFIGTIWAEMLYEVLWNLIDEYGITDDRIPTFANGVPTDGRFLALKLVTDGMKLQPCRPTFIQARDAIIDADKALTGGKNACLLWKGFAKRGLGADASRSADPLAHTSRKNSYNLPGGVCGCNADLCLRALRATTPATQLLESRKFCGEFTKTVVTDVSLVKPYLTAGCAGNVISRVSSACGCIPSISP